MPGVTPEMIDEAKKMDLLTYLMNYDRGELVKESANTYSTRTHDSLKISNGKWMWFSRGFGGYTALDYLIKVEGCSFIEAVQKLTGQVTNTSPVFSYPKNTKKANKLLLPKANENNDRVIKYLLDRGIDKDVVLECISEGLIFESEAPYHNAIFVGFDEEHIPRHAAYRATNGSRIMGDATGSSKAYSFHIVRNENIGLNVFESAIDLLSYITFRKIEGDNWKDENYLSLSGVYAPRNLSKKMKCPVALERYLKKNRTEKIRLHFDNDLIGRNATAGLVELLKDDYIVINDPAPCAKDFNECLCMYLGIDERNRENE